MESLESFKVTDAYITFCVQHQQSLWNAVEAEGQILRETSDLIYDGWAARTRVEDLSSYRYTDGYREQERLYDAATGDVYMAPAGWYEANRSHLQMNDLQILGDAALPTDTLWGLYRAPTSPYGEIH